MNRVDQRPLLAFSAALAAVAILSIMDALMKHLVLVIGIVAVSVWRALANLAISGTLYLPVRTGWPERRTLQIHVIRGLVVTVMAFLFFWGIGQVHLAQAIALTFIAPLIALVLAALFLGESIGARSIAGSATAFAGVLVIVFAQVNGELGAGALLGSGAILASALCYAANIVLMRRQALAAKPLEINFFQSVTVMAAWLVVLPAIGAPALPSGQWHWIAIAAVLSSAGTLLFSWAYARAEASYLAVTEYSAFLWASALGWLVFREPVGPYTVAGAVLIVAGCLLASRKRPAAAPEIEVAA